MSKFKNKDWWLGRTEEQKQKKQKAKIVAIVAILVIGAAAFVNLRWRQDCNRFKRLVERWETTYKEFERDFPEGIYIRDVRGKVALVKRPKGWC